MPDDPDLRARWGPSEHEAPEPASPAEPHPPEPRRADRPAARRTAVDEPMILEAEDIERSYAGAQGVLAVRGASLGLAPKEFVALMGPSGSGKTTFIGVLSGLDPADAGVVRWKGRDLGSLTPEEALALRRSEMGVVFQSFGLLPTLSAVENVELPLRVAGDELERARQRAETWLGRLGLGDRLNNRTFELSAGQQQRVAVARALITEPTVVLADEPIAEVDTENADLILEALWEVIRRGGAVLAATHNPEALRYASRVVLFRDGRIEREGTPEELADHLTTD
jgi:putative ABC transport system ATP-binding protein